MSERTVTISKVRPLARRSDDHVVAFLVRVTLEEAGQSAFDDIPIDVEPMRTVGEWTAAEIRGLATQAMLGNARVSELHRRLDSRISVRELPEFPIENAT